MSEHDCQSEDVQHSCGKHHTADRFDACCFCYEKFVKSHFEIPGLIIQLLDRWVEDGIMPGGFLTSVLCDKPVSVVVRSADDHNKVIVYKIIHHLINKRPHQCWGNEEKVRRWAASGGEKGQRAAELRS